jgi:NADPH:quinone reductase-like Zn-dependent oxidoreductase
MQAITYNRYGGPDVLQTQQIDSPKPGPNEVLVKIHAASVTTADSMMRAGIPRFGRLFIGLTRPRHNGTGTGFAGEIESVGRAVKTLRVGDSVFGESLFGSGTHAEYVCVSEYGIVSRLPDNIDFSQAAALCDGALTSLSFLRDVGEIQPGQHILINGASGSLGTAAVQLAKHYGASVTAVCSSDNAELVRALGADQVIDYRCQDIRALEQRFDLIFDTVGKLSVHQHLHLLTQHGQFLSPVLGLPLLFQALKSQLCGTRRVRFSATGLRPVPVLRDLLRELKQIVEAGRCRMVIEKKFALDEIVAAHRHIETGHKKGNIVIMLKPG